MTKLYNRVKVNCLTVGTGALQLSSPFVGFQSFSDAGAVNGSSVRYVIEDRSAWEIGYGTFSDGTITRNAIESSASDNAAINLSGNAIVFCDIAAQDMANNVRTPESFGAVGDGTTDDYPAIAAGIAYLKSVGGGTLRFGAKTYRTSQQIVVDSSHIFLEGVGHSLRRGTPIADGIAFFEGTRIQAMAGISAAGATVVFRPENGTLGAMSGGASNMVIDGDVRTAAALRVMSWERGRFDNLFLQYATEANLDLDVIIEEVLDADAIYGHRHSTFSNIETNSSGRSGTGSCVGLRTRAFERIPGATVVSAEDDALATALQNPTNSYNIFENCLFYSSDADATDLQGLSDCMFIRCNAYSFSDAGGWVLQSGDQDERLGRAVTKSNTWIKCLGYVHARSSQLGNQSSKYNRFYDHLTAVQFRNNPPLTIEEPAGGSDRAHVHLEYTHGVQTGFDFYGTYSQFDTRYQKAELTSKVIEVTAEGGVSSITVTDAIPAGAFVMGVTSQVTTRLWGVASYRLGVGGDVDAYGISDGFNVGSGTSGEDVTIQPTFYTADTDITITPSGAGTFNDPDPGSDPGVITLTIWYFRAFAAYT